MRLKPITLVVTLALVILMAPLAVEAQPPTKVYRIGYVRPGSASVSASETEAFTQRLRELGYGLGHMTVNTCGKQFLRHCSKATGFIQPVPDEVR